VIAAAYDRSQLVEHASDEASRTSEILSEHARAVFQSADLALDRIIDRLDGHTIEQLQNDGSFHEFLVQLKERMPELESAFVASPVGRIVSSSRAFPIEPFDVTDREYFLAAQASPEVTFVSAPFRGRATGTMSFTVSKAITRGPGRGWIVGVTILPSYFRKFYETTLRWPASSAASLVRRDGAILVRYPDTPDVPLKLRDDSPLLAELRKGQAAGLYSARSTIDGKDRIAAFTAVGSFPFVANFNIDRRAVMRTWYEHLVGFAAIAALSALALSYAARSAGRKSDLAIREREARLDAVVSSLPIGVLVAEAHTGRILLANKAASRIARSPFSSELIQQETVRGFRLDGTVYDTRDWPLARSLETAETVEGEEIVLIYSSGEKAVIRASSAPVYDDDGRQLAAVCVFEDVTRTHDDAARIQALMKETLHRAKNQLAIVGGLARRTGRDAPDLSAFLQVFERRLNALAVVQRLLVGTDWRGVDVRDLVTAQVAAVSADLAAALSCTGDPVLLRPETAQALALAIDELAEFALRSGSGTPVAASWSGSPNFEFVWRTEGGSAGECPDPFWLDQAARAFAGRQAWSAGSGEWRMTGAA
jgi:two-component sensor histidine kinase